MATNSDIRRPKPRVKAKVAISAPVGEIGQVNVPGVLPWAAFGWIDQLEHVPELVWPASVRTYSIMRTDAQVNGLYAGVTLPIRRYKWMLSPNGAQDSVVINVAQDLGLPIQGDDTKQSGKLRIGQGFSFDDWLRHALLALAYGYYYFELDGEIRNNMWRMIDIAPRPPATISQMEVDKQGNLVNVKQAISPQQITLDSNRLFPAVWEREGGNWLGRSIFRFMYKHWLLKDRMLRVDAMRHERNGLGVPTVTAPPGATAKQMEDLNQMAMAFRAGETSGGSLPNGAELRLVGTSGSVSDILGSINYQDEAMARSLLMMFMQLGQTMHGSRALGDSFIDYFALAQETVAIWVSDQMSQFFIEKWVNWNFDEQEPAPRLVHERNPDPELAVADLAALIEQGAITVDPELEQYIRGRYLLPPKEPTAQAEQEEEITGPQYVPITVVQQSPGGSAPESAQSPAPGAVARRKGTVVAVGTDSVSLIPLPNRPLRRQPYTQEVQAKVDFAQMDATFNTAKDDLVTSVKSLQAKQIADLEGKIKAAKGNLTALSKIEALPVSADAIQTQMVKVLQAGAQQALTEAAKQGKALSMPDLTSVIAQLSHRATAVDQLLANSIAEAAGRRAIALTGTVKTPEQVATATGKYLSGLSDSYLHDQLGGALQQAMNAGRREVMDTGNATQIYASELLDSNTCGPCTDVDGTEYPDVAAAENDYPTGGYLDCDGGPRCRGTLIAVYGEVTEGT